MGRVVLIRAGSTDYDEQRRIQGTLDVPLSGRGAQQARDMASQLAAAGLQNLAAIYCGPGESCLRTAEAIRQLIRSPIRQLEKLQNLNQGLWQGLQVDEVKRKFPRAYRLWRESPLTVRPPGGETVSDAYDRIRQVLRPVLKRHKRDTIGLVVPEPIASIIYCYLSGADLTHVWDHNGTEKLWQVVEVKEDAIYANRH